MTDRFDILLDLQALYRVIDAMRKQYKAHWLSSKFSTPTEVEDLLTQLKQCDKFKATLDTYCHITPDQLTGRKAVEQCCTSLETLINHYSQPDA